VDRGFCICVFDGTDRIQHAFWRDIDPQHPAREHRSDNRNVIEDLYIRMDDLVRRSSRKCQRKDICYCHLGSWFYHVSDTVSI